MPTLASNKTCTGCMACKDKCPKSAIYSIRNSDSHQYICIDNTKCIECKLCEKTCPIVNGSSYGENILESSFFAGWSDDKTVRDNGATTGIFGSIAYEFINSGGWICGAVMNGLKCKYLLTNNQKDIPKLQGSKYTYSNPDGIYSQILKTIKEGNRILFSGLPCHVAALLSFIPQSFHKNLYTIDLICGGVSSPILIERFSKEYPHIKSILKFRDKTNGWSPIGYRYSLTCETNDGKIIRQNSNERNLVTDGFACELTDRMSCYNCNFSFIKRKSDITIGDLWKDQKFPEQHRNGVSSILIHSEKGLNLIKGSNINLHNIESRDVLIPNHRIYNGKSIKHIFPERLLIGWLFNSVSYKSLVRIYCSDLKTKNILWWPFALYRVISFRIAELMTKKSSAKILKSLIK